MLRYPFDSFVIDILTCEESEAATDVTGDSPARRGIQVQRDLAMISSDDNRVSRTPAHDQGQISMWRYRKAQGAEVDDVRRDASSADRTQSHARRAGTLSQVSHQATNAAERIETKTPPNLPYRTYTSPLTSDIIPTFSDFY